MECKTSSEEGKNPNNATYVVTIPQIKTEEEEIELLLEEHNYMSETLHQPTWSSIDTSNIKVEIIPEETEELNNSENEVADFQQLDLLSSETVGLEVEIEGDDAEQSDAEFMVQNGEIILSSKDLLKPDGKAVGGKEDDLTLKQYYQKISNIIDTEINESKNKKARNSENLKLVSDEGIKKKRIVVIENGEPSNKPNFRVLQFDGIPRKIGRPRKHPVKERVQLKRGRPRVAVRKKKKSYYVRKRAPPVNYGFTEMEINGNRRYVCDTCGYDSRYSFNLRKHVRSVHLGERPYKCDLCDKAYSLKSDLAKHVGNNHMAIKPFACPHCEYRSGCKHTLKIHIEFLHMTEKKYKCQFCDYASPLKRHIREHIRSRHTFEKPFHCNLCDFKGNTKQILKTHIQGIHLHMKINRKKYEGPKKPVDHSSLFKCHLCQYSHQHKSKLQAHLDAVHYNNKQFKCDKCSYTTNVVKSLKNHVRKKHENFSGYFCDFCNKNYKLKDPLKKHIFYLHMPECLNQCNFCDFKCISKGNFISHMKIHPRESVPSLDVTKENNDAAERKYVLKKHSSVVRVNSQKRYQCNACNLVSDAGNMYFHISSVHLKLKPFSCIYCTHKASKKYHLKAHIFRKHPGKNYNLTKKEMFDVEFEKDEDVNPKNDGDVYLNFLKVDKNFDTKQYDSSIIEKNISHEQIKCPQCMFSCFSQDDMASHITSKHLNINPYICCYCEFGTNIPHNLRMHIAEEHPTEKFQMIEIKMEPSEELLTEDIFENLSNEDFSLDLTSEKLFDVQIKDLSELNKTVVKNTENSPTTDKFAPIKMFHCSYCDFKHKYKAPFDAHVKSVHMKIKPFVCTYCHRKTSTKHLLKVHIKNKHPEKEIKIIRVDDTAEVFSEPEVPSVEASKSKKSKSPEKNKISLADSDLMSYDPKTKMYKCEMCDLTKKSKSHLDVHIMRSHLRYQQFKCVHCDFTTSQKVNLKQHNYRKHLGLGYQRIRVEMDDEMCEVFVYENENRTERTDFELVDGKNTLKDCVMNDRNNSDSKTVECLLNKSLISPNKNKNTTDETVNENDERNLNGSINSKLNSNRCDFSSSDKYNLKRHELNVHFGKKPFLCVLCSFKGSSVENLKSHILRKHPEESHLNEIIETNNGEDETKALNESVECSSKVFNSCDVKVEPMDTLEDHMVSKDLNTLPFFCPHCDGCFDKEESLRNHIKMAHSGIVQCPLCEFSAKTKDGLVQHIFDHMK